RRPGSDGLARATARSPLYIPRRPIKAFLRLFGRSRSEGTARVMACRTKESRNEALAAKVLRVPQASQGDVGGAADRPSQRSGAGTGPRGPARACAASRRARRAGGIIALEHAVARAPHRCPRIQSFADCRAPPSGRRRAPVELQSRSCANTLRVDPIALRSAGRTRAWQTDCRGCATVPRCLSIV